MLARAVAARHAEAGPSRLPTAVRTDMERRFGTSLSDVRVRTDAAASAETRRLGARASTQGSEISFAPGWWSPDTPAGRGLIAHELTHVLQQRNGRFRPTAAHAARSRLELEHEAERAERAAMGTSLAVAVHGCTCDSGPLLSGVLDDLALRLSGGLEAMADQVARMTGSDPIIAELQELRRRWAGLGEIYFPGDVVAQLEAGYARLRQWAPSWLPVPELYFGGPPSQQAAPLLAIPAAAVLLFLAFLIVMWWLITNLDPATRRAREQAVQELIEWLRRGVPKPPVIPVPDTEPVPVTPPLPRPDPEQEKKPDPKKKPEPDWPPIVDPLPPDVTDDDTRRRGCRIFVCPDMGNDLVASLYCDQVAPGGGRPGFEFRVYPPGATIPPNPCSGFWTGWAQYDELNGGTAYECKCGYQELVDDYNSGVPWRRARAEKKLSGERGLDRQMRLLSGVADACGLSLRYIVSTAEFQQLLTERWHGRPVVLEQPSEFCD